MKGPFAMEGLNYQQLMEEYKVTGLSAVFFGEGKIVGTEIHGRLKAGDDALINSDTMFNACSISKFFTAILTLVLAAEGKLNLDENVQFYLTNWKVPKNQSTKKKPVTLRSLLSHQAGFIDQEDSFQPLDEQVGFPDMKTLLDGKTVYLQHPCTPEYEPGSDYNYSDTGYCVLQQILEDVTGKAFAEILNEKILKPLDLTRTLVNPMPPEPLKHNIACGHNKEGKPFLHHQTIYPYPAAAGVWTSGTDLANLTIAVMQSLKEEESTLLPEKLAQELFTCQGSKDWIGLGTFLDSENGALEFSSLGWGVGFQSLLAAEPYQERGMVILTNTDLGVHQLNGIIGEIYRSC